MNKKIKILMCGSKLSVKGGMVSVINNYLEYDNWDEFEITYISTHIEKNKIIVALYFVISLIKVVFFAIFGKYDILYLHTAERGSFYRKAILVRILRKFGIKTVLHHHAAEFEQFYSALSRKRKVFVNKTLELTDLNIVLSYQLMSKIRNKSPYAKVEVLYNAVGTYRINPYNPKAGNILFLGRLGERKGTYDLLKAIKILDKKIPKEISFYLCGDGDIEGVTKKIKEYEIKHRIAHIGWIDGKQKQEFLANTMINVLPSYNEGLPMSILETMAYGIPNISTSIASIPEVIHEGENGYMIEPGNVEKIVSNIEMLYKDDKLRTVVSNQAWEDITQNFSLDAHILKLKDYLKSLVWYGGME